MTEGKTQAGSRYLYDGFSATSARIEANERVAEVQFGAISARLERIEGLIERLERRLWMTIYGMVAIILSRAALSLMNLSPV